MADRRAGTNPVVSTIAQMFPGYGQNGAKPNPFMRDKAVRSFRSWVYIAATLNANAFAGVPLRLYVRKRKGREKLFKGRPVSRRAKCYLRGEGARWKQNPSDYVCRKIAEFGDDFEEVTTPHPALQLLRQVNPWQNGFDLSTLRLLYLQLTGNAYIYPVIDPSIGRPVELWPMPSQYVQVVPDESKLIGGYTYGRGDQLAEFDAADVMRWAEPSLDDPYYGMARTQAVWDAIEISATKALVDKAIFQNNGRPDWLLLAKNTTDTTLDRLEAKVDEKLRGPANSGRMLAISGEVQAVQLNFTPAELGDQNRVIEEIAGGFGVPISKLLANDPNRANAETGDAGWMRDTILPYCRKDEETLNSAYLPLFGIEEDAVLAYDNPVPINEQAEIDRITKLVSANVLWINDAREELGYERVDNGDQFLAELTKPEGLAGLFGRATGQDDPTAPKPADEPAAGEEGQNAAAQFTQLNGAQITSALDIVIAAVSGEIPRDTALGLLQQLFGMDEDAAEAMLASAGKADVPTTPNPIPTADAPEAAASDSGASDDDTDQKGVRGRKRRGAAAARRKTTVVNGTQDGLARDLPDGAKLIAPLVKMFAEQRKAVMAQLAKKSLDEIEREFVAAARIADPACPLAEGTTGPAVHAYRRGMLKAYVERKKDGPGTERPGEADPAPKLPTSFVPLEQWSEDLAADCRPIIETIIRDEGKRILNQLGASKDVFAVFEENIPKAAQQATLAFCQATNETTSLKLDKALSDLRDEVQVSMVSGETYAELEKRVDAIFDEAEQYRSERIARTEGSRASHTGELMGARDSGVVSRKSWLASADACEVCQAYASMGAIALDKQFAKLPGGGDYGDIDSPPAHPHCVCSLTYEIGD